MYRNTKTKMHYAVISKRRNMTYKILQLKTNNIYR